MRILRGGSAELQSNRWLKFDVELDESDLQALCITHGIDQGSLSVLQKFQLMCLQAELLVTVQMESHGQRGEVPLADMKSQLTKFISNLPKAA